MPYQLKHLCKLCATWTNVQCVAPCPCCPPRHSDGCSLAAWCEDQRTSLIVAVHASSQVVAALWLMRQMDMQVQATCSSRAHPIPFKALLIARMCATR